MTKNEILEYVMTTPENVNRQVLGYMLDELEGEGGSSLPFPVYKGDFIRDVDGTVVLAPIDDPTSMMYGLDVEGYYMIINSAFNPQGFIITHNGIGEINNVSILEDETRIYYSLWPSGK